MQNAFQDIVADAQVFLTFVQNTVTSDYNSFVDTAAQYGRAAEFVAETSDRIGK